MWSRKLAAGRIRAASEGGQRGASVSSCLPVSFSSCFLLSLLGIRWLWIFQLTALRSGLLSSHNSCWYASTPIWGCDTAGFIDSFRIFACTCVRTEHQLHLHSQNHRPGGTLSNTCYTNTHKIVIEWIWSVPVLCAVFRGLVRVSSPVSVRHYLLPPAEANWLLALQLWQACLLICVSGARWQLYSRGRDIDDRWGQTRLRLWTCSSAWVV